MDRPCLEDDERLKRKIEMKIVELIRLEERNHYGTFGVLKIDKEVFCATLEPPDRLNKKNISSIPAKQYRCRRIISPKFGETFEVMNVPGRSDILFHAGNTLQDTQGCIILGQHWGKLLGDRAVLNSGRTFHTFMGMMDGVNILHLTIKEIY